VPVPLQGPTIDQDRQVRNEAAIMTSRDVAALVAPQMKMSEDDVIAAVHAEPSSTSDLVTLSADASSAAAAVRLVNTVEKAYETVSSNAAQHIFDDAYAQLEGHRDALQQQLLKAQSTLAAKPGDPNATLQRDTLTQEISNVRSQEAQLSLNEVNAAAGVRYFDAPEAPSAPVAPKPLRNAMLGLLLGVFVAVGYSWWRSTHSRLASDASRVSIRLGVPLLGDVPPKAVARFTTHSAGQRSDDAFRWIAALIERGVQSAPSRVVAIAGVDDGRASASVALRLATTVATDRSVLLIDADTRAGALTSMLHATGFKGFTDLAVGRCTSDEIECQRQVDGAMIQFIPVGATLREGGAIYGMSEGARRALATLDSSRVDLVLVNLPPAADSPETPMLAQHSAGVVFVVSPRTRLPAVDKCRSVAETFDLPVLGYVFDRSSSHTFKPRSPKARHEAEPWATIEEMLSARPARRPRRPSNGGPPIMARTGELEHP
jgi:non-specific protein-tyrosine kinase